MTTLTPTISTIDDDDFTIEREDVLDIGILGLHMAEGDSDPVAVLMLNPYEFAHAVRINPDAAVFMLDSWASGLQRTKEAILDGTFKVPEPPVTH